MGFDRFLQFFIFFRKFVYGIPYSMENHIFAYGFSYIPLSRAGATRLQGRRTRVAEWSRGCRGPAQSGRRAHAVLSRAPSTNDADSLFSHSALAELSAALSMRTLGPREVRSMEHPTRAIESTKYNMAVNVRGDDNTKRLQVVENKGVPLRLIMQDLKPQDPGLRCGA